jgi:hypothetical protein
MSETTDNPTAELIASRLPGTPLVSPEEIAAAIGSRSTNPVLRSISVGRLAACRVGGRYVIARTEAERWIRACAVIPDEAE